ncbi:UPF0175 family protein [Thomasclavelia saccharogumia]|uniref:UPF0175 family protein n=1 Tax=Thomasclavelia saccharogumia TaxID=341225 RepID=UPI00047C04CF|nr:UPF0175 family protein [Thomasclavelia saccharogumia]
MSMRKIEINIPEGMVSYVSKTDEEAVLKQNAMILYPYIQDDTISYGKAAELLGVHKLDLIALYGKLGISYLRESVDELTSDLQAIKKLRSNL